MHFGYYRLPPLAAASVSLALVAVALAGCGSAEAPRAGDVGAAPQLAANMQKRPPSEGIDTESTIWTVLGMAKKPSERRIGPEVGDQVSPSLWLAAHDALNFVPVASEDPIAGVMQTDWYTPPGKPNERLRVNVFILSYALRTDSLSLSIDREERTPSGGWKPAPVAQQTITDLENAIIKRARQIHAETYRATVLAD